MSADSRDHIVKLDDLRLERIPILAHDMREFGASNAALMEQIQNNFSGKQDLDFYHGLVTAHDYAAGVGKGTKGEPVTQTYLALFTLAIMSGYVTEQVTAGKTDEFNGQATKPLDKPMTFDKIRQLVPSDSIYDYSEIFIGDKSPEFYRGLVTGFDSATMQAQIAHRDSPVHVQLDLMTMFVAFKILEQAGETPSVELLSPKEYKPVMITDDKIGYAKRRVLD